MTRFPLAIACLLAALVWAIPGLTQTAPRSATAVQIPLPSLALTPLGEVVADIDLLADRLARAGHRGEPAVDGAEPPVLLSPLRPMRARGRAEGSALRFDGERRALDFSLYLPEAARLEALRIATLSSINVLPERSSFQVYLNDVRVGGGQLDNVAATGHIDLPVDPGLARTGDNRVRIELVQYHRIFCGPEASFALWTDVDLALSGGVLRSGELINGPEAFVLGVAATAVTGAGLEIRGTDLLGEARDAWVGAVTQRITAALGGDPLPFRFTRTWSVATSPQARARVTFLPAARPEVRFLRGGDGAQVMVIGVPPGTGPMPLPEFDTIFAPLPVNALAPLIETRRPVPLAEVGFRSLELRDRYSFVEVPFRLPDDYAILTNQKSEMTLTYIYAEALPTGSVLQIYINGTNIRVLPLRGEAGRLIENFPVRFEARHLRGGRNEIGFEVMVPGDPDDLPCPARETPVVAISDQSTILAPYSPSMYLPDMHFALSAMTPGSVTTSDVTGRAFSALDVLTLRAALSTAQRPDAATLGARLMLMAPEDLGGMPLGGHTISRAVIESVLAPPPLADLVATGGPTSPLSLFGATRRADQPGTLTAGLSWITDTATSALQWMHPHAGQLLNAWLIQQRGLAILFQLDPEQPRVIWMMRAPTADTAHIASALVAARGGSGEGPRGQVSVLGHDGRWHNWIAPDREPILLEPITLSNARHVIGNAASAVPIRYVVALVVLALISAILALRFVIATRED